MPLPENLEKAFFQEIKWDDQGTVTDEGRIVRVQFNPQSLKVSFSNQVSGGDQRGGAAIQFSGRGTTKLSLELWFDVTAPDPDARSENDVRHLTKQVIDFMKTEERKGRGEDGKPKTEYIPPGVRFQWGRFLFEGVLESVNENLEFFSEDGRPLRASLSVSLMKQDVEVRFPPRPNQQTPGSEPQRQARQGETVQQIAGDQGRPDQWQSIAQRNNIENPRRIPAGTPIQT